MNIDAKILLSWDPESGLSALALKHAMANVKGGYVNVTNHHGTLVLVWSSDWIDEAEAEAAVKNILSSRPGPESEGDNP